MFKGACSLCIQGFFAYVIVIVLYLDHYIGDPNFLAGLCWGACSPALASCVLLWSRESVPLARVCTVLLVSSLYRKLVLLFLIYILLTFDQKKKIDRDPTIASQVMALPNRPCSLARPDVIITEYGLLTHSMEKDIRKLQ